MRKSVIWTFAPKINCLFPKKMVLNVQCRDPVSRPFFLYISFFQKNPFHGFFKSISRFSSLLHTTQKNPRKNFFLRENWIKNCSRKHEEWIQRKICNNKTSHGKSRIFHSFYKGKLIKIRWIISSVKVQNCMNSHVLKRKKEKYQENPSNGFCSLEVRIYLHADLENSCYSKNHYFYSQWNSCCCGHC